MERFHSLNHKEPLFLRVYIQSDLEMRKKHEQYIMKKHK